MSKDRQEIIKDFYELYIAGGKLLHNTAWMGLPALKIPLDLWMYQEMIYELRPDYVIECGTFSGGSAIYLASVCDQLYHFTGHNTQVITIDIWEGSESALQQYKHPRVKFIRGSTTSDEVFQQVKNLTGQKKNLVILDSDHSAEHVYNELKLYSTLISIGGYIIVEDTCTNGPDKGAEKFLSENQHFIVDPSKHEKFLISCNPNGFLKRIS